AYPAAAPGAAAGDPPADGHWVVATSFSENCVVGFSRTTGKQVGRVQVGHHPMGIAVAGKRREVYLACGGSGRLGLLPLPGFSAAAPLPRGDVYPVSVAVSEDETTAWVGTFFGGSVIHVDLERRKALRTISIGALVEGVALSRDGSTVLAAARDKGIVFIDAASGKI